MKPFLKPRFAIAAALLAQGLSLASRPVSAQEQELRLRVVEVKGMVSAYHDENDETARLYQSQSVDDGDKVTTGPQSEAVLRLSGKAYLYLAPHTKIHITRLRLGDKGLSFQVNLVTGRMLCQFDQVVRRNDELSVVSYEGGTVVNYPGKTRIAKANETIKLDHGKFRYLDHHLKSEEQGHLQAWQELLSKTQGKGPAPGH
jgi:hypothetical protein